MIISNQAQWGEAAGVTAQDFSELEEVNARIARIDVFIRPAQKFAEMLIGRDIGSRSAGSGWR